MSLKNTLFLFLFIIFFSKINAQNFELGEVSKKELQEKLHPSDTNASAAILYKKARTFFKYEKNKGFVANHEYEYRIKIYKKEGLEWANFKVPYYVGYENYNDDVVKFSKAMTYNLVDGKVVQTKLNNEGSFKKNVNEYWNEASIAMPNVKAGSIVEFKYILKSEAIVQFPVFKIQYGIPVNYAEYNTEIPEYFIYKPILLGFVNVKSNSEFGTGYQNFEDRYSQSVNMSYKQINSTYIAENVPSLIEEEFVDNIENYRASIHNELEQTRFPEEKVKDYSVTWEGVAKSIYEDKDFGKEIDKSDYFAINLKTILKDAEKDSERLKIIFEFVKIRMNWDRKYGVFAKKGVEEAYRDRIGNVAEINFILIAMLKMAGINTNPVLVSTKDHGVPVYPSRTVFNYVIASAEIDGKQVLLDATQKYTTQNILPLKALNWTGRLIRVDGTSEEINLAPTFQSNVNNTVLANVDAQGQISGKLRIQKTNYEAYSFREKNILISNETYLEKLENELGGLDISDYKIENRETDLMNPITETFTFVSNNHCERIGEKLFLNPLLFFTFQKNPFVMEKRQMPLYFGFPKQMRYNLSLEIPQGYEAESMPSTMKIATEDNTAVFIINSEAKGNIVQISIISEINKNIAAVEYYETIRNFFQKMIVAQNEKIVLKKI
ncbi:MAG TPA: DUF3857 domain-containing protein [Flavobacterium sp.]|uniref:DUF3857 domain-containing protein n=1 Tax=Flavobacterium sp. TaxID=239 RepID=UPI002F4198C0